MHHQFAFFLAISEANTANSWGRARGTVADSQLTFWRALAHLMLENTLDDNGNIVRIVDHCLRTQDTAVANHELKTWQLNTGKWLGHHWATMAQKYQKLKCFNGCNPPKLVCTYCACNKSVPMYFSCHMVHYMSIIR